MSDTDKDLIKLYEKEVLDGQPRHKGLSPILEEHQDHVEVEHGMWSEAIGVLLTTLRYLAPATLLTFFWGQQSFLFRLLKGIDSAFRAIVFSSEEQKEEVLQWLSSVGPQRIERLDTVWNHGWVLCSVLDEAVPGACAGHPLTRLSLKHAQAVADHYLGVEPVFSRQELESTESLSRNQEWKLAAYLSRIKEALSKLTSPVSQPVSQRTSPETTECMMDYLAKGSGLKAAQVNNKMFFKIYPATQQSLDPGEITILIRGPKDTYGMSVLPPIYGKAQAIRQKLLGLDNTKTYTENALPITQGAAYLRAYGKNDMTKTFHIPKRNYDIKIEATPRSDYIKIGYTVTIQGKYEIFITSKGQHIAGSPFLMRASNNIIGTLERESYCLEDGEEIGLEKKVVLRIVDFVTEKMLLRDNGSLEKISDDEAEKLLMTDKATDYVTDHDFQSCSATSTETDIEKKSKKLNKVARSVVRMNRVCKVFDEVASEKRLKAMKKAELLKISNKLIVPDIVNSTFMYSKSNQFCLSVNEDTIPFQRERSKSFGDIISQIIGESNKPENVVEAQDSLEEYKVFQGQEDPLRTVSSTSSSNTFLNDINEEKFEKDLRTFVKTEFETNNSQVEETPDMPIKIIIEESSKAPSPVNNPFIDVEEVVCMERPKTPVLKIIKGEVEPRDDSVYVDKHAELLEEELLAHESLAKEFLNPFFNLHQKIEDKPMPVTDFIIGAPVSLPPILRAKTPDSEIDSLVVTSHPENSTIDIIEDNVNKEEISFDSNISPEYSTPLSYNVYKMPEALKLEHPVLVSSTFHSMDSSFTDNVSDNHQSYQNVASKSVSKKDMWDSAYVSIDESNSSPDNNNNDNVSNDSSKSKPCPSDDFSNMGPAEKEMWLTCNDLRNPIFDQLNDSPINETKDKITPNLEEINKKSCAKNIETRETILNKSNNFSMSKTNTKEKLTSVPKEIYKKSTKTIETKLYSKPIMPVTFAELNTNLYVECLKNSNVIPTLAVKQNNEIDKEDKSQAKSRDKVDNSQLERQESVNSASVVSDVKRHAKRLEGKISAVQSNVTESGSVSQTLQLTLNNSKSLDDKGNDQLECRNIVLIKKNYWDERIKQIEEITLKDENKEKKRRLTTRNLIQNDSLTKKRAKEVANNVLAKDKEMAKPKSLIANKVIKEEPLQKSLSEVEQTDPRLVEKWLRYWDTKLESENDNKTTCFRTKHTKSKERINTLSKSPNHSSSDEIESYKEKSGSEKVKELPKTPMPEKEEILEEVFKAFETSPKRFFGTSRKQILNKIDYFLEKQSTADSSSTDASGASADTGLVSSRISMFHTISNTEEPSWVKLRRKCQSMNNISRRKFSESSVSSTDTDNDREWKTKTQTLIPTAHHSKYENEIKEINKTNGKVIPEENFTLEPENIPLKEKRARLVQRLCKSIEEGSNETPIKLQRPKVAQISHIKNAFNDIQKEVQMPQQNNLRKSIVSKSEMDIFNKATNNDNYVLDVHKSYDELPKISVKNFISLYESVEEKAKPFKRQKHFESSSSLGAAKSTTTRHLSKQSIYRSHVTQTHYQTQTKENWRNKSYESVSSSSVEPKSLDSNDLENSPQPERDTTYLSFSDIELEIVENSTESAAVTNVNENQNQSTDYKSRFKMAKQYFQSLEELPPVKKPRKLNECEILLIKSSTESLDYQPRKPRRLRNNKKSNSLPSSELSKIWNQLQDDGNSKLMKISEKFNVEDLYSDVTEGKLSRQGSLRGIPHKKAVLEAFRSMESLVSNQMSPYEMATTQLGDFANENQVKNAQTYLSEYPYLPTTEPSKYHSRLDPKSQGLISLKELKLNQKRRRNSTPDLRLSATFAVNL